MVYSLRATMEVNAMFRILVVEDDGELQQLFCRVLTRSGFHATGAFDGVEALELLEHQYFDLMISDIMMPRMDGYELVRTLREADNRMPVLMITAREGFQDLQYGFLSGADDYMVKPVNVNEMVLPQKEFQLLYKLLSTPGHIFTRQQLMDDIWGPDSETEARTVDVHINRLRDRFRTNPDFSIQTVRGIGYKAVKHHA